MIDLVLTRFCYSDMGTFGRITVADATLITVERPWLDNKPNVSCIPEGEYECRPRFYYRGGYDAVEVLNVPGRSHILFHVGNTMLDVQGCIAVTSRLGVLGGLWAGLDSKTAFSAFMERFNREFGLRIERYRP